MKDDNFDFDSMLDLDDLRSEFAKEVSSNAVEKREPKRIIDDTEKYSDVISDADDVLPFSGFANIADDVPKAIGVDDVVDGLDWFNLLKSSDERSTPSVSDIRAVMPPQPNAGNYKNPGAVFAASEPIIGNEYEEFDSVDAMRQKEIQTPFSSAVAVRSKKNKVGKIVSDVIFYIAIIAMLCVAVAFNQSNSPNKSLLGYRFFNVLSESMQSEIPAGSIVLTKVIDKNDIQIGDDISFYYNSDTIVTHQVVEIMENYNDKGERAFVTKGVDNAKSDEVPTTAANVIGVVKFHIPWVGFWLEFIGNHVLLVAVVFILIIAFSFCLRFLFSGKKKPEDNQESTDSTAGTAVQQSV